MNSDPTYPARAAQGLPTVNEILRYVSGLWEGIREPRISFESFVDRFLAIHPNFEVSAIELVTLYEDPPDA